MSENDWLLPLYKELTVENSKVQVNELRFVNWIYLEQVDKSVNE